MSDVVSKEFLVNLVGRAVVFNGVVDDYEDYPEAGMKARIKQVSFDGNHEIDERCHRITFDYGEFDKHNLVRETANYYDSEGRARLTAREAGFYSPVDTMFIGGTMDLIPFDIEVLAVVCARISVLRGHLHRPGRSFSSAHRCRYGSPCGRDTGLKDVKITGFRIFGCGEDDVFHTGFDATTSAGKQVSGVVCSGFLKGATVRFD